MQYVLMVYQNEKDFFATPDAERNAILGEYMAFSKDLSTTGKKVASARLGPVASASSVRIRDGKLQITDGPFADTREQLGGFFMVEAKDLDEAIALAQRIPSARTGTVEVRPVLPVPSAS